MVEINEVAEQIADFEEKEREGEGFRRRVAVFISVLAMILAITALGGNKTGKELLGSAISASDTWNFYQAKSIRQTATQLAADELAILQTNPALGEDGRKAIQDRLDKYHDAIKHYESEADGSGKKELKEKALHFEHERAEAEEREPYFALAEAILQIAIVLASAAVATNVRFLVAVSGALGGLGTLLTLDAYTLLVHLPL